MTFSMVYQSQTTGAGPGPHTPIIRSGDTPVNDYCLVMFWVHNGSTLPPGTDPNVLADSNSSKPFTKLRYQGVGTYHHYVFGRSLFAGAETHVQISMPISGYTIYTIQAVTLRESTYKPLAVTQEKYLNGIAGSSSASWPNITPTISSGIVVAGYNHGSAVGAATQPSSGYTQLGSNPFNYGAGFYKPLSNTDSLGGNGTGTNVHQWFSWQLHVSVANNPPGMPTSPAVTSASTDTTPSFSVNVSDPDANEQIKGRFLIYIKNGAFIGQVDSAFRSGNGTVTAEYATPLAPGEYEYYIEAIDDDGASSGMVGPVYFNITQLTTPVELDLSWGVEGGAYKDLGIQWAITQGNQKDLGLMWSTKKNESKDLELAWRINTPWSPVSDNSNSWTKVD